MPAPAIATEVNGEHCLLDHRKKGLRPDWVRRQWPSLDSVDYDGRQHDRGMIFPDTENFVGFLRFSLEGPALHVGVIAVSKDAPRGTGRILFESAVRTYGITSVHGRLISGEGMRFFLAMKAEHPSIEFPILVGSSWLPPPKHPRRSSSPQSG